VALLALLFALYFFVLSMLEIASFLGMQTMMNGSIINAFVLGTIMATYFKGAITKKESYPVVASLIATIFSILMFLAFFASGNLSFAAFGIIAFPYFLNKLRKLI